MRSLKYDGGCKWCRGRNCLKKLREVGSMSLNFRVGVRTICLREEGYIRIPRFCSDKCRIFLSEFIFRIFQVACVGFDICDPTKIREWKIRRAIKGYTTYSPF